jgi:hypothetical protein
LIIKGLGKYDVAWLLVSFVLIATGGLQSETSHCLQLFWTKILQISTNLCSVLPPKLRLNYVPKVEDYFVRPHLLQILSGQPMRLVAVVFVPNDCPFVILFPNDTAREVEDYSASLATILVSKYPDFIHTFS